MTGDVGWNHGHRGAARTTAVASGAVAARRVPERHARGARAGARGPGGRHADRHIAAAQAGHGLRDAPLGDAAAASRRPGSGGRALRRHRQSSTWSGSAGGTSPASSPGAGCASMAWSLRATASAPSSTPDTSWCRSRMPDDATTAPAPHERGRPDSSRPSPSSSPCRPPSAARAGSPSRSCR